jgi:hypothetical protein
MSNMRHVSDMAAVATPFWADNSMKPVEAVK